MGNINGVTVGEAVGVIVGVFVGVSAGLLLGVRVGGIDDAMEDPDCFKCHLCSPGVMAINHLISFTT
eukprot:6162991-Ditylum_brightwellii.AAC.1